MFLNEQKVTTLSEAAKLADEFILTHKNVFVSSSRLERPFISRPMRPDSGRNPLEKARQPAPPPPREARDCFYCHRKGHVIADCITLKRRQQQSNAPPLKGMGLVNRVSLPRVAPTEIKTDTSQHEGIDPCFQPFILEGSVSVTGCPQDQRSITILRDTGGSQSIICAGILPLSSRSSCRSSAVVQGVGMSFISAPLHQVYIESALVSGLFKVAVLPALPIKGVDFILGNDLAKGKVMPVPEVVDIPDLGSDSDPAEQLDFFPACVVTRAQTKKYGLDLSETFLSSERSPEVETRPESGPEVDTMVSPSMPGAIRLPATRKEFIAAQQGDVTLTNCHSSVVGQGEEKGKKVAYFLDEGLLMRCWMSDPSKDGDWGAKYQVVVPAPYRLQVLSLAHDHLWSGHMGVTKTYDRVLRHFFWPRLKSDVREYCRSCHVCQITGKPNQGISPAPLCPIPVMGEPFERVIVDCVGPLPKTKSGNQFLLTVMCASTRFPEAIPLRKITAPVVSKALVKMFTVFGLPKVVQTDQGTNFKSRVFAQVLTTLGVKHITSSPYHPESQGALERFHQTLKSMLKKCCSDSQKDWDDGVPFVLFASREVVQESLGFSPAELVFGHEVRGPLKLLKEHLISPRKEAQGIPEYVAKLRARLQLACSLAKDALTSSQVKMKQRHDRKAVIHSFQPGDKVLILTPTSGSSLSAKFSGPYVVEKKVSETNYVIHTPDRRRRNRVCHVNMIKRHHTREENGAVNAQEVISPVAVLSGVSSFNDNDNNDGLVMRNATPQGARLLNSEMLCNLSQCLSHLPDDQQEDIQMLIEDFPCLFNDVPSQTTVIAHDIVLTNPKPIKQHAYRASPTKREVMEKEVDYLVKNGFAVQSSSAWSSPCLLELKSDGTPRFCTDFRKVNSVTVPDAHPLPLIDDCIDEIGPANYVSKLDMLKGYWQVPLTQRASEISAFVTPDKFLQYTVMPFGLCNAPATFQRLVNKVLGDVSNCKAYLDDIVVYSNDWVGHIATLREVFKRLSAASLTLNLAKCEFGKGHHPLSWSAGRSGSGVSHRCEGHCHCCRSCANQPSRAPPFPWHGWVLSPVLQEFLLSGGTIDCSKLVPRNPLSGLVGANSPLITLKAYFVVTLFSLPQISHCHLSLRLMRVPLGLERYSYRRMPMASTIL